MALSQTVMGFLDARNVDYDVVSHGHSKSAVQSARKAHISPKQIVKAVLMFGTEEYLLALVPADRNVDAQALERVTDEGPLDVAAEDDLAYLFRDCSLGAVPAVGTAFGVRTVVDDALLRKRDIFFEGGDHEHLIHVNGASFARLTNGLEHGRISAPLQGATGAA